MYNPQRVLVSEDTDLWQGIFARLLTGRDLVVHQARDLPSTLAELDRCFFNAVVVDLALDPTDESRLDGIETMRKIRALNEGTQAIVLTGKGTVSLAVAALRDFQVFHFLEKEKFQEKTFVDLLNQAAIKAYRLAVGPGQMPPPETLVRSAAWHRFSSTLGVAQDDVQGMAHALIRQCMPLRFRGKEISLELAPELHAVTADFWSKWFGQGVRIVIGRRGQLHQPDTATMLHEQSLGGLTGIITKSAITFAECGG